MFTVQYVNLLRYLLVTYILICLFIYGRIASHGTEQKLHSLLHCQCDVFTRHIVV